MRAVLLALAAGTLVAAPGSLSQLPGPSVGDLRVVAVSPDGRTVYAAGGVGSLGVLDVFARDRRTGSLTQLAGRAGCIRRLKTHACATGLGLETPAGVAVSPSGKLVVTTAQNGRSLGVYRRRASGALTPLGSVKGFDQPSGLVFRSDGKLLLVADRSGVVSLRIRGTKLTRVSGATCEEFAGCNAVAFSPDGGFAYGVAGGGAHGSVTVFTVAPEGTVVAIAPALAHAVKQPLSIAVAPDGRNVYVVGSVSDSVVTFSRDATTGLLVQTGCITMTGSRGACAKGKGIAGAWSVAVSRDGKNVYVASYASKTVTTFVRAADGTLRQTQVLDPRGLTRATAVAVSPDGRNVYAAGRGGVAAFARR